MADKRDPNTQNSARPSLWSRPPGSHRIVLNQSVQRARFGLWESPLRALCSLFAKNRILTVLGAVLVHRLRGGRGQRNWETWLLQTQWTVWEGPGNGWDLTGTGISSLWPPWITRTLVSNYNKRCARHRLAPSLRHLGWMQGASGVRGLVTRPYGQGVSLPWKECSGHCVPANRYGVGRFRCHPTTVITFWVPTNI